MKSKRHSKILEIIKNNDDITKERLYNKNNYYAD